MSLPDLIAYICLRYPYKRELSKARVNKLLYLADWESSLEIGHQLSDIQWRYNHYGPYVDDVVLAANSNNKLQVQTTRNDYGDLKELISADDDYDLSGVDERSAAILDHIISKTKQMNFKSFIEEVYSTYPVKSQQKGQILNLVELATRFRALRDAAA